MNYEVISKYKRIRELREDNDYSQKEIANKLNQYITTYQRWESGDRECPTHIIIELCKIYNVSSDYILELTDDPKPLPKK